ncbi:GspMb/PilO family protein [Pontiellaceae bacterium B12227]|nr:GspMb/PilO family protein [Pontiellaceae bacterium B12227]
MKKFKISQREKVYLIAGGAALFIGVVLFPAYKAAAAYRTEQLEQLEGEIALLESLNGLLADARAIQTENEMLHDALKGADELLFPPIENRIMTQTKMIKLLNEMGPDLDLEVSAGRSGIGDASTQMNLSVRGKGRYPEILKFMHRVETYRPLILVDSMMLNAPKPKKSRGGSSAKKAPEKTKDPTMSFKLTLQLHTRAGEEGGA